MDIAEKEARLQKTIRDAAGSGRVLVAFSGGVDSSLLLWESVRALGPERVTAVTAVSPTSIPEEVESAREFTRALHVTQVIHPTEECLDRRFMENPPDRCYICKQIRGLLLKELAEKETETVIFDGTQADDDPSDRPGMRALEEIGILTPLATAGIGKEEIRALLRAAGFEELAAKKAEPCLATRIASGTPITLTALERIRDGERFLKGCGLETVRLRDHYPIARIQTDRAGMALLLSKEGLRQSISDRLRELGYDHATVDLEEYGVRKRATEASMGRGSSEGPH